MKEDNINFRLSKYNGIVKENEDIYREFARRMGLSECAFWILYMLRTEYTAPIQSELCAQLHAPKQTVNSALKKLEADGYLLLGHTSDRRSKCITLTQKGARLCGQTIDKVVQIEREALGGLTDEEQEMFLSLFQKLTDLLKRQARKLPQEEGSKDTGQHNP
ncbi:MarR family transcriptional regulator [Lachnospiraceae bacterium]|jgi:DNA-binding MarR family transcriptional regulator|nr:MarR family transcriptional regulator [Lachnospiraceae bacterium]